MKRLLLGLWDKLRFASGHGVPPSGGETGLMSQSRDSSAARPSCVTPAEAGTPCQNARAVGCQALLWSLTIAGGLGLSQTQAAAPLRFVGICDASAVVALNDDLVAVGDDEDNAIRIYSSRRGGNPLFAADISSFLKIKPKKAEVDIEAAARLGDRIYWISSHGCNAAGKPQRSRRQFFATTGLAMNGAIELKPLGKPYHNLLEDLCREPRLARFNLRRAAGLAPKSPGALNIEGLAATPEGYLLIGFRNPIPDGKALLVPLLNPGDLLAGKAAQFGEPLLLDLHGLGIRSITDREGGYLIVAGRPDEGGQSRLYEWRGGLDQPRLLAVTAFFGLNPEAISFPPAGGGPASLFVTSDDGTAMVGGKPCKSLKDPRQKSFRALRVPW